MKTCLLFFVFIVSLPLQAEVVPLSPVPYLQGAVRIDGKLDEAIWKNATKVIIQNETNPSNNTLAQSKAVAYLYEDGNSLYVGIEAEDAHPEQIRAQYSNRDNIGSDDHISILIDTFNDQRGAFVFELNPLGVQADKFRDENRNSIDSSWNAIWYGAGQRHNQGYTLEYEIPFSALRFPNSNGPRTWGIEFNRTQPRNSRIQITSAAKVRGNDCYLCQIPKYHGFASIKSGEDFQIIPSIYATRSDERADNELNPAELHPWQTGDFEPEVGLDLRWGINQGNVVNLTLNPDFSQISSDESSVSVNSSFAPSFPEKRDFFLEGQDFFRTSRLNLVHTRNIASPEYGVKLTGKNGSQSYGLLYAKDEQTHIQLTTSQGNKNISLTDNNEQHLSSEDLVARYRLDVGSQSNVGLLLTQRSANDYNNSVASLDGIYQINTANSFSYQMAYSNTQNPEAIREDESEDLQACQLNEGDCIQNRQQLEANEQDYAYNLEYKYKQSDYELKAHYQEYGKDFRADLGNVGRVGYNKLLLASDNWWYGETGNLWTKWGVRSDWDHTYRHDGLKLEEELEGYLYVDGPRQLHASLGVHVRETYHQGKMYDEASVSFYSRIDPLKSLHLWTDLSVGEAVVQKNNAMGDVIKWKIGTDWRLGAHLSGSLKYKYENMDVESGKLYDVNQVDLRMNLQLDLANSIRVAVSHSDVSKNDSLYLYDDVEEINKKFSTQIVYTYEPNPKTLCYIGYADGGKQDEHLEELARNQRSVFMKLSYAFQI